MATLTPAIRVTVGTFSLSTVMREFTSVDSYEDGDPAPHDPCDSRRY